MGLLIPFSHTIHRKGPQFACTICPAVFTEDERHQYERHVISHTQEELAEHSPAMQAPGVFGTAGGDEDWAKWIEDHRRSDPQGLHWDKWGRTDEGKNSSGIGDG